jgi:hypothetical protein
MSFVATDPASGEGQTNTWLTPLHIIQELGPFDLDPCGFPGHPTAERLICLPNDGLIQPWHGRVWLNPPYGKHAVHWLEKLQKHGNGIALVFARLETNWLRPFLRDGFFVISGRLAFESPVTKKKGNAGTASILIPFGRKNIGSILSSDIKGEWYQ